MLPLPKGAVWQAFLLLCLVLFVKDAHAEVRVVCYYTNWSVYRPGTAKFNPQNINPYLCTHLIYAFGGFTKDNTLKPFDKYQDIEQGGYAKFTGLKSYNKQLKTMLAIGGWNEASSRFSPLVANPDRRQQFIRNILKFLRQNHFDGLDLDWEYPAFRDGGKPRDRDNYAQFVEELRAEFDRESSKTGRPRLLLTMAVPAGVEYIEKGYDIPKLNANLDWFNILSYDYHSAFEPSVNHHAPLYSLEEASEYNYDVELNIDYTIKFYLEAGADPDKLVLGIPTYGRSYTLINEDDTAIGAPAEGPGEQGDATREKGYLAYYEICQGIRDDPSWEVVQPNDNAMGPYAHRGNQWVGYDDEAIVAKKARYVAEHGMGGIMFWSLDNDDFRGTCTGKPYPLIEAAKEAYLDALGTGSNEISAPSRPAKKPSRSRSRAGSSSNRNKITEETSVSRGSSSSSKKSSSKKSSSKKRTSTAAPRTTSTTVSSLYIGGRTTTPAPPTTPDPGADFKCEEEGFFPHPRDCKKYFWCLDSGPSNLGIVAHQFTCPSGLYFNTAADSCDFTRNVVCKKNKEASTTKATPVTTTTSTTTTTTTRAPIRITAATSSYSYIQRSTTAKPNEDDEEEYDDEEPEEEDVISHEEDPKVIKELIDLIKRVGGLEELEKQLQLQEDGTVVMKNPKNPDQVSTTPSSISQSLYAKVLTRPNSLNSIRNRLGASKLAVKKEQTSSVTNEESSSGAKYTSVNRNSRPGPQNAGIDKLPEFEGFLKDKPKYVTINRPRPTKSSGQPSDSDDDAEDDEEDEPAEEEVEETSKSSVRKSSSSYVNIQRTRPTKSTETQAEADNEDEEEDEVVGLSGSKTKYQSVNRVRGTAAALITVEENEEVETASEKVTETRTQSSYQTLTRTRGSTSEKPSEAENEEIEDDTTKKQRVRPTYQSFTRTRNATVTEAAEIIKEEEQVVSTKQTYQSPNRFRPSTSPSPAGDNIDEKIEEVSSKGSSRFRPSTRGTTVATTEADGKVDTEELQKKNRYSLFNRRQSTVGEDENVADVASTEPTVSRSRGTTIAASSSFVNDDAILKSVGSTNRYQIYDRRSTTLSDAVHSAALTLDEAESTLRTHEEGAIPAITVQLSESSLAHTTPIPAQQDPEIQSVTSENTNIVQGSTIPSSSVTTSFTATTTTPLNLSPEPTISPDLQQLPIQTSTQDTVLNGLSSPNPTDTDILAPTSNAGEISISLTDSSPTSLPASSPSQDPQQVVSTDSGDQTADIVPTRAVEVNAASVTDAKQDNTDKVTLTTIANGFVANEEEKKAVLNEEVVGDLELTKPNSKSSLNNVNSESSLSSSIDNSDSDLIITTKPSSTTTSRPVTSASTRTTRPSSTNRFSTRRRTSASTTTTTTEQPDESGSRLSSPRPFSLPTRRRTRPSQTRTTPTTESSLENNETTARSRPTAATKTRSQLRPNARRPILSVRRRITPTTNSTSAEDAGTQQVDTGSPTTIAPAAAVTTNTGVTTAANTGFTNRFNRNRIRPTFAASTTSEPPSAPASAAPKVVIRRKFARPVSINKRLPSTTTSTTSTTESSAQASEGVTDTQEDTVTSSDDDSSSVVFVFNPTESVTGETTRTTNKLFRRRFSSTTPTSRTTSPSSLDVELSNDSEVDQEVGSSVQDTKFTNHRFNQIGENLDNEDDRKLVEALNVMSKAPPPIGKEETFTRRTGLLRTTASTITSTVPITTSRRAIIRGPQKTTPVTTATPLTTQAVVRRRRPQKPEPFEKVNSRQFAGRTYRPVVDYDYYDDDDVRFVSKSNSQVKVILHGRGIIECLDQGNFPHPLSCKKFISCAKMETGGVVGWEYTCPKGLSYDPVGGICNWSSGLGCKD